MKKMEAKLIKNKYGDDFYYLMVGIDTFATTHKESFRILSLKNCQAIENGYDLDELAKEKYPYEKTEMFSCFELDCKQEGFIEGAKTILEILGDKKFSELDLYRAFTTNSAGNEDTIRDRFYNVLLPSLQQTEWDVEICNIMDCIGGNPCNGTSFECNHCTNIGEPKLDTDGCLILKRI